MLTIINIINPNGIIKEALSDSFKESTISDISLKLLNEEAYGGTGSFNRV